MLIRHLYLKICLVVLIALVLFAVFALLLWNFLSNDQFNRQLFAKTSALTSLLLPEPGANDQTYQQTVSKISRSLDVDITVFNTEHRLLAASGDALAYPDITIEPGTWKPEGGEARWASILDDGRLVIIDLDRMPVPSESIGFALVLLSLALTLTLVMYPFVRNLTSRLEHLQTGVEQIGSGYLGARVDVKGHDEIADLATSFNQAAEHIEQLVNSQRMLLANASHELRTPLTRIRMGVDLIQSNASGKHSDALTKDIHELDSLIDDVILMTRLDTEQELRSVEQIDFLALVAEECARFSDCDVSGTHATVTGDSRMLQYMVRNVIDNAYKHGQTPVEVSVRNNRSDIEFIVTDAGEGIAEHDQGLVFGPFYRAKNKQNIPGSGLGLALVKKIALAHGGAVSLGTQGSSSVTISLPSPNADGIIQHRSEDATP